MSIELVHIYRGEKVESIHRGDIVCVDEKGKIVFEYGDGTKRTFWRSSAKPFQVIPFMRVGGIKAYNIDAKELALMTSSHSGEANHLRVLGSILEKIGKTIDDLDCGVARPMFEGEYKRLLEEGIPFSQGNNPCSGKHSHMLALGQLESIDLENYIEPSHKIQEIMLEVISEFTGLDIKAIDIAIDGCGVPVFGLPLYNMALAYTKLKSDDSIMQMIAKAMTEEPYYVAGTGRLDTVLMEETQGRILAKLGAESVYCMTDMPSGHGIAMKTEDGGYRALNSAVPALLKKHGYIDEREYKNIVSRMKLDILNNRKQIVGYHKIVF